MNTMLRYILFQLPFAVTLGLLLYLFVDLAWIKGWHAIMILVLWLLKDALLYPFLRRSFEESPPTGTRALVGRHVEVLSPLAPEGWVHLNGERWQARTREGRRIPAGRRVLVVDADKFVLVVEQLDEPKTGAYHR